MADSENVGDLEARLAACPASQPATDRHRIDIMNALAWALRDMDMPRARSLAEEAGQLAERGDYEAGIALSMRSLGYLNQRGGDYVLGLHQLFRAQAMCQTLHLDEGLADALDGIAGIFIQVGDYQEALRYAYQQQDVSERVGDLARGANARNNLAAVFFETGDYPGALQLFDCNLAYALAAGDDRIASLSHANLAETHLALGDRRAALAHAWDAVRASEAAGFPLFQVYARDMLARAHLASGEVAQAAYLLREALALSRHVGSQVTEVVVQLHLGEAYRDLGDLDASLECLLQCEAVAVALDTQSDLARVHLQLSDVLERRGDLAGALRHLRRHEVYREAVAGERAEQRMQVLRVVHDAEAARKEAALAERRRLARDLHDSVTQSLYSVVLFARSGREAAEDGDRGRLERSLREVECTSLDALREMRLLLYELRPPDAPADGLSEALKQRLDAVERRSGLRVDVQVDDLANLGREYEADLLHIVVEAVSNVVKHAKASRVSVRVTRTHERVEARVADDGSGFDPALHTAGMGLRGVRERAIALGGEARVISQLGSGTLVEVLLPLPREMAP